MSGILRSRMSLAVALAMLGDFAPTADYAPRRYRKMPELAAPYVPQKDRRAETKKARKQNHRRKK